MTAKHTDTSTPFLLGASAPPLTDQLAGYARVEDLERFDRLKNSIGMLMIHNIIPPHQGKEARVRLSKLITAAIAKAKGLPQ